jgi:tartrate-resistant acid phosphatase type 5
VHGERAGNGARVDCRAFAAPAVAGDQPDMAARIKPLLDAYGVDAYLAGHDHIMSHLVSNGTDYFISGGGSNVRVDGNTVTPETQYLLAAPGFSVHSVNATHMQHSFIAADGSVVYQVLRPLRHKPSTNGG